MSSIRGFFKMEKHFVLGEEGLEWMRTKLPDEILLFFVNLNWTLYHEQPTRDNPTKLDQIRQKCEAAFNQQLEIKTNEIKLLKITTEKQLQFTRRGNSGKTDFELHSQKK